jgi:peptidoglycan/xylan/chitin deacetylase (PgdA/CDA1 family)
MRNVIGKQDAMAREARSASSPPGGETDARERGERGSAFSQIMRCSTTLSPTLPPRGRERAACIFFSLLFSASSLASTSCPSGTLYLTFDTGHMEPATQIADILAKHQVKATFFLANEKTKTGDFSLDDQQKPLWQRLAKEGHAFGSHTWDHHYFRGDVGADKVSYIPWGAKSGRTLDRAGVCAELKKSGDRFREMTGRGYDGLWRAPGGKTTPRVLEFANSCGYTHVHWADAGFLGDELPSDKYPNDALINRAVANLRDGDIMMAHLGIWSRKDPYWPMLDPLITRLKAKGFCFATLKDAKLGAGVNQRVKK